MFDKVTLYKYVFKDMLTISQKHIKWGMLHNSIVSTCNFDFQHFSKLFVLLLYKGLNGFIMVFVNFYGQLLLDNEMKKVFQYLCKKILF